MYQLHYFDGFRIQIFRLLITMLKGVELTKQSAMFSEQAVKPFRRLVNISLTGLKIETQYPIESKDIHLRAIDLENNPVEIRGRVVYCEEISPEMFHLGIGFVGSNMDKYKFMTQLTEPLSNYQVNIAIGGERLSV